MNSNSQYYSFEAYKYTQNSNKMSKQYEEVAESNYAVETTLYTTNCVNSWVGLSPFHENQAALNITGIDESNKPKTCSNPSVEDASF